MSQTAKDYARTELSNRCQDYDILNARSVAIHEAAHAVAMALVGVGHHIDFICNFSNDEVVGYVRYNSIKRCTAFYGHKMVNSWIMKALAGPAAEYLHDNPADSACFVDELWDSTLLCSTDPAQCPCDVHEALRLADGDSRRVSRIADQTFELVMLPRVLTMIVAVAAHLPYGTSLSGITAIDIMQSVWGKKRISLHQLGTKWPRRFPALQISPVSYV